MVGCRRQPYHAALASPDIGGGWVRAARVARCRAAYALAVVAGEDLDICLTFRIWQKWV